MQPIEQTLRISMLEDDPDQAQLVRHWLESAGYSVHVEYNANEFLKTVRRESFDLYLLDWILPDLSGLEVLARLRNDFDDHTPVVIATVKSREQGIVRALETGADDYLVKPIRRDELIARMAAILRRVGIAPTAEAAFSMPPFEFDLQTRVASLNGDEVTLTRREFELAVLLFRSAGKILSRGHLLENIWGIDNMEISTRTVDTHISRIRKKLRLNGDSGWRLSAIYQHGYRVEKLD